MSFSASIPSYNNVLNPVWITITGTASTDYTYTVKDSSGSEVFSGVVTGTTFSFNISEVVQSLITDQDMTTYITQGIISRYITDFLATFTVEITDNIDTITLSSFAVPGGITDRLFRAIVASGSDAFKSIFFNTNLNFALTSRSRDTEIFIRETELNPIAFFGYFSTMTIQDDDTVIASITGEGSIITELITVDLETLRKYEMTCNGKIINRFDFYTDGYLSFSVNIIESKETRGYSIQFLNSFNVWEKAEICGELDYQPDRDNDGAAYKAYDSITDSLLDRRNRVKVTEIIKADMGYTDDDRKSFLEDMLISKSCYLCVDNNIYECTVYADQISLGKSNPSPDAFPVTIKMVDNGYLSTPYIDYTKIVNHKKIFDNPFAGTFE